MQWKCSSGVDYFDWMSGVVGVFVVELQCQSMYWDCNNKHVFRHFAWIVLFPMCIMISREWLMYQWHMEYKCKRIYKWISVKTRIWQHFCGAFESGRIETLIHVMVEYCQRYCEYIVVIVSFCFVIKCMTYFLISVKLFLIMWSFIKISISGFNSFHKLRRSMLWKISVDKCSYW